MIGHAVANAVAGGRREPDRHEGDGARITFYGSSFVCDPRGDKLAELGRGEPGIALATLDLEQIQRVRASMGFFRDRRPACTETSRAEFRFQLPGDRQAHLGADREVLAADREQHELFDLLLDRRGRPRRPARWRRCARPLRGRRTSRSRRGADAASTA